MKRATLALCCIIALLPAVLHSQPAAARRLPTGVHLDPAVASIDLSSMPLTIALPPAGGHAAVLLSGHAEQGVQIIDLSSSRVTQTLPQPAAFVGAVFSTDGHTLFASGGNEDRVYRYQWRDGQATADGSIELAPKAADKSGTSYPAGIAVSADGRWLYVAENLADRLAVVDVARGLVVQRFPTQRYPYAVIAAPSGEVYASAWGGTTVTHFRQAAGGFLVRVADIEVGRHPSALTLSASGNRLFVALASVDRIAVADTAHNRVVATLSDPPPGGVREGSTPNALALSPAGDRLWVAEADNNAVAAFDLSSATAGIHTSHSADRLAGRIPTDWYPTAVAVNGEELLIVSGKGRGTAPNPRRPRPDETRKPEPSQYTLGQLHGTLARIDTRIGAAVMRRYSARVAAANGWTGARGTSSYPPFRHVIYIIKENRTFDQVFGDMPAADSDPSLVYFPRAVAPNHHALADRFGLFDRFFVNAEVSADGHNWSMAAYASDYTQKTTPSNYSSRGRTFDYQGTNREVIPERDEDDVASPGAGYIWDLALRKGISLRDYGEFAEQRPQAAGTDSPLWEPTKHSLEGHTSPDFPGWDMAIRDQRRADVWLTEFQRFVADGRLPALEIIALPNDHTEGAAAGKPTPRAHFADNDLALGRMIEALSQSVYWRDTVVFVLEDDAQSGPDHVDSHRSVLQVISAWNRGGTIHRFVNTTDVLATMEEILGLESLSQFDRFGRPLRGIFAARPDLTPYTALIPAVSLDEKNPEKTKQAEASSGLDLTRPDAADDEIFNRILWSTIKGENISYPPPAFAHGQ